MASGPAIHLVSACTSAEQFVAAFCRYARRDEIFVPLESPLPIGRRGVFALTLRDGGIMLEGGASVTSASATPTIMHGRAGITLRFERLDPDGQALFDVLEHARVADQPIGGQLVPRRGRVPSTPRPTPPVPGGRIDANAALAECVAIEVLPAIPPLAPRRFARGSTAPPNPSPNAIAPQISAPAAPPAPAHGAGSSPPSAIPIDDAVSVADQVKTRQFVAGTIEVRSDPVRVSFEPTVQVDAALLEMGQIEPGSRGTTTEDRTATLPAPLTNVASDAAPEAALAEMPTRSVRVRAPGLSGRRRMAAVLLALGLCVGAALALAFILAEHGDHLAPRSSAGPPPVAPSATPAASLPPSPATARPARAASSDAALSSCLADVVSTPAGAEIVSEAGQVLGMTPMRVPLACGIERSLMIRKPRYATTRLSVVPAPDAPRFSVVLTRPHMLVRITSDPPGVTIMRSKKILGVTPTLVRLPATEPTTLTFSKPGYVSQTRSLTPGQQSESLHAALVLATP